MTGTFRFHCFHCGHVAEMEMVGRQDTCSKCGRDLRVCCNCVNYNPALHNACQESQADRVVDKEKANFCDWFQAGANRGAKASSGETLKSAAEALFKKK